MYLVNSGRLLHDIMSISGTAKNKCLSILLIVFIMDDV